MNCNEIVELAPLYISGELDADRSGEFDGHLKLCPECMLELERYAHVDARLREIVLAEGVDAARVDRRVRELISAGADADVLRRTPSAARRWTAVAMGVAAAALLLLGGYRFLAGAHVGRVYADAAADHQKEVVEQRPRKWVVDPAQVAALAEQQGVPGSVPLALAAESYHLQGARLCLLDGHTYLHLRYSGGTKEFSVYLRQRDAMLLPGPVRERANGKLLHESNLGNEHIASFDTTSLTAMVVTNESAEAALSLASSISAAL